MPILEILTHPDERLYKVANKVTDFSYVCSHLVPDAYDTMIAGDGMGIAATQLGMNQSFFIIDFQRPNSACMVFINPLIQELSQTKSTMTENCLSLPDAVKVERPSNIIVTFFDCAETQHTLAASGLLSRCIQHEMDHLIGITMHNYTIGIEE